MAVVKSLKSITKGFSKVITDLENLIGANQRVQEQNRASIERLLQTNVDLQAETDQANTLKTNLQTLLGNT